MFDCWKHLQRQQDTAVILVVHLHPMVDKYQFSHTHLWHSNGHHNRHAQQTAGIDVSLLIINWCINPIVRRVEWWFDGKHVSPLNHMKSNCTSYSSCLQRVRQLLCASSFDTDELEIAINYSVYSQSVNASFTWDLTIQSVRFGIVFLTEHQVFDILSVLVDTHRTRSAAARLPINRTRSSDYL